MANFVYVFTSQHVDPDLWLCFYFNARNNKIFVIILAYIYTKLKCFKVKTRLCNPKFLIPCICTRIWKSCCWQSSCL